MALWLSQIVQAYGIKTGVEFWRQTMPRSMGSLFWQFNDCWPITSWSSVDYFGRWKALQYTARRFYAPILVSGREISLDGTVDVFVTSDRLEDADGELYWNATDVHGNMLANGSSELKIPARQSRKVQTLDLSELCRDFGVDNVLVWLKLDANGQTVSENLVAFVPPKLIKLVDPQVQTTAIEKMPDGFLVTFVANNPALWVWLNSDEDANYSDNFLHLPANSPRQILVQPKLPMSQTNIDKTLRIQSLFDTYS